MRARWALILSLVFVLVGCGSDPAPSDDGGAGGGGASGGDGGTGGDDGHGGSGGDGDEELRDAETVCRIWKEGHVLDEPHPWIPGLTLCESGATTEGAIQDAIRRINMFRKLAGLPPVTEDPEYRDMVQACAVLMNANQMIDHYPSMDWTCWTNLGAEGAETSNLAIGIDHPADAQNAYMWDIGVEDVGHRRWLLGFQLGKVAIGFAGNCNCTRVLDMTGKTGRTWSAYPPAGPVPIDMIRSPWGLAEWSFHTADSIEGAGVALYRLPDEEPIPIAPTLYDTHPLSPFPAAAVWRSPRIEPGDSFRVVVTLPGKDPVDYVVEFVDCDALPSDPPEETEP